MGFLTKTTKTTTKMMMNPSIRRSLLRSIVGTTTTATFATAAAPTTTAAAAAATASWSGTLGFGGPESDFTAAMEDCRETTTVPSLPSTWAAALRERRAAIVVATARAPHRVVHVNGAWERLCGYTQREALHEPIGPLLQRPQQRQSQRQYDGSHTTTGTHQAARHLMERLRADHYTTEREAYLENFTHDGRPFLNHVRVGPLYWDAASAIRRDEPDFLVAILEEVQREQVPLRIVV